MVTLSNHPKQVALSCAPKSQDVVSLATPLNFASVHQLWTQALSLTPPSPSLSLSHLKRLLRTLKSLPRPLLTPAQTAPLYLNVALILAYLGEYFLAAESFHKAVELDGNSAIGWHGLGGMKFLLGDWKAARKAWNTCLSCLEYRSYIKYRVWKIGGSFAEEDSRKLELAWVLEKSRVEWNISFAELENKEKREPMQEQVWGINGIPAGLVFGPSFPSDNDKFYAMRQNPILKKRLSEVAKANAPQRFPNKIPRASIRTSSHGASTKPLPALPNHTSTSIPLPRGQKGLSLSRLFTRPRTFSASKAQVRRPDLPTAPFARIELSTSLPIFKESTFYTSSGTRARTNLCREFQKIENSETTAISNPDVFDNVSSESDPDAKAQAVAKAQSDADELDYYFSTRTERELDIEDAVTSPGPVVSTSLPALLPRTSSYRPGRIQYPLMEMRDERRMEMRERNISSQGEGRQLKAISTKAEGEEGKKVVTTLETKERSKIAPMAEKKALDGATIKIQSSDSKEGPSKVEDKNPDRTASKTDENTRDAVARKQHQHNGAETDKVEIGNDEVRARSGRSNLERQISVNGRGAEKKQGLETVLEMATVGESQETEENDQVRRGNKRSNAENRTATKGRPATKDLILEVCAAAKARKALQKDELRGNSKRRDLETRAAVKHHEERKEKIVEMSMGGSHKIEMRKHMPTEKEPEEPEPSKPQPTMQEPKLEYLKPIRFEGFNGEWRERDLAYEAELRMEQEKVSRGK